MDFFVFFNFTEVKSTAWPLFDLPIRTSEIRKNALYNDVIKI